MTERIIENASIMGRKSTSSTDYVAGPVLLCGPSSSSTFTMTQGTAYYQLVSRGANVGPSITFDVRFNVTTVGAAGSVTRLGLYSVNRTTGLPDQLLVDAGTVDTNASTGEKTISVSIDNLPTFFFYSLVAQVASAPIVRSASGVSAFITLGYGRSTTVSASTVYAGYTETSVTGSLPSSATPTPANFASPGIVFIF